MSNYTAGHAAEKTAADYLQGQGFTVRHLNWKTRLCEIDIIAQKKGTLYFVEVKQRRTANQGMGLEYVTPKKIRQMSFAAELWVTHHGWHGPYQLAVVSIDAGNITFVDLITG